MDSVFYGEIIRFNKKELFLELVLQLNPDIDEADLKPLQGICWTSCLYERQELVRVLIEHKFNVLPRINLMESLLCVIRIGNMEIFTALLENSASPGLWKSSSLYHYPLLDTAMSHNRIDML